MLGVLDLSHLAIATPEAVAERKILKVGPARELQYRRFAQS